MDRVKIVEIKEDITSRNNALAAGIRQYMADKHIYYLNVMSGPGSGKTTLITRLVERLKKEFSVGVIEADIDSAIDAETMAKTGVKVIQMHTGGACHITCQMSQEALDSLGLDNLNVVILENIGNLVCPAEFDTGATFNLVLLSVPEGDDKPLKYPLMFQVANAVVITKLDVSPAFDFSVERAKENIAKRNPNAPIFAVSAVSGEGIDELFEMLKNDIVRHISTK